MAAAGMICIDGRFGRPVPRGLTQLQEKEILYGSDVYFQEAWEDLESVAGGRAVSLAREHTVVVIKPEAIVGRRADVVLAWLASNGFRICRAIEVQLSRHIGRALWTYQWNIASRERKDACDLLLEAAPALLLIVARPEGVVETAATYFSRLKGPADPRRRTAGQLREILGATCTQMNFVHSADEPADVVREISVLLAPQQRRQLFEAMLSRSDDAARASDLCAELYAATESHPLTLPSAIEAIRGAAGSIEAAGRELVLEWCREIEGGRSMDWQELSRLCHYAKIPISKWDMITIVNHCITMDLPGIKLLLPSLRSLREGDPRAVRYFSTAAGDDVLSGRLMEGEGRGSRPAG